MASRVHRLSTARCGPPRRETVLVSAAAGAVGCWGQIAVGLSRHRHHAYENAIGWWRLATTPRLRKATRRRIRRRPGSIDVISTTRAVRCWARRWPDECGAVACCGAVANYDTTDAVPAGVPLPVTKRIRMEGFVVMDFTPPRGNRSCPLGPGGSSPVDIVEGREDARRWSDVRGRTAGKLWFSLAVRPCRGGRPPLGPLPSRSLILPFVLPLVPWRGWCGTTGPSWTRSSAGPWAWR